MHVSERRGLTAPLALACLVAGLLASSIAPCAAAPVNADKMSPGEHDAPLADIRLHYVVAGQGPVVVVSAPGWGSGSLYLQRGLVPLEAHNTLLFFDPRGSGKSSRPADAAKMSTVDMADDIEHLRQFLGLPKISLLGHSDGGSIALDYAERYPASLGKLVIVDGSTLGQSQNDHEEGYEQQRIMARISQDPRYKDAAMALQRDRPPASDEVFANDMKKELPVYFADPEKNVARFAVTNADAVPSSWALTAQDKANRAHDWHQEERLSQVHAPTLVVVGKQDWICPVMVAQHVSAGIAGSKLVVIDGSGHFPWIEQPNEFFGVVAAFLKS